MILLFQQQQKELLKDISHTELLYFVSVSAAFQIKPGRFCIFRVGDKSVISMNTGATGKVSKKFGSCFSQGKNKARKEVSSLKRNQNKLT